MSNESDLYKQIISHCLLDQISRPILGKIGKLRGFVLAYIVFQVTLPCWEKKTLLTKFPVPALCALLPSQPLTSILALSLFPPPLFSAPLPAKGGEEMFPDLFLWPWCCAKNPMWVISSVLKVILWGGKLLLPSFSKWSNWVLVNLKDLPKVAQQVW